MKHTNVDTGVVEVRVGGEAWAQIRSLLNADSDARVYSLDSTTGSVAFGDGVQGSQPPIGASIEVSYRTGGGEAGNLKISVFSTWPPPAAEYLIVLSAGGLQIRAVDDVKPATDEKRPLYFFGERLEASDLQKEQEYHLEMRYLHNLNLYGTGRVVGLELSVPAGTSTPSVVISPGLAIDSSGRELILRTPTELPICDSCSPKYVAIHSKKDWDGGAAENILKRAASIANCLSACLVAETDVGAHLTIGKLELGPLGWFVDPTFP